MLEARERGIPSEGGLYMLVSQAIYACEIFTGEKISEDVCKSTFDRLFKQKENIVLIGMPSSGKSTVGKYLAEAMGRELVDTDEEIIKKINMPIADYFAKYGESAFRDVESEVVKEIGAKNGLIIATGGGAILRKENVRYLKQNGRLYFLNRSLEKLTPTGDRPLSSDFLALKKRYDERYDLYVSSADKIVDGDGTASEVAEIIKGEFLK